MTPKASFARLLVLTGSAPGNDGVGAILQRQILEEVPRPQLRIIAITSRDRTPGNENSWVDENLTRRFEHAACPHNAIGSAVVNYWAHKLLCQRHLKRLAAECVRNGLEQDSEALLAVLDCPSVIFLAEEVASKLKIPLYCFVMDGPLLHVHHYGYSGALRKKLLEAFDSALASASRIAAAGEAMEAAYGSKYQAATSILRQGLPYAPADPWPGPPRADEAVRIGFAGSLTAREAFESLLSELDRRRWRLAGREVILRLIGAHVRLNPTGPQHIEYLGWRNIPDLVNLLQECHLLYLPQPFSMHLREFAELSFPNKLCVYVPARRPIMLHTPPSASLQAFFGKDPCGPVSTTLHAENLLADAEQAIENPVQYAIFQQSTDRAFREKLNLQRLRENVVQFLARG